MVLGCLFPYNKPHQPFAPVVQWIECKLAELVIEVRFLAGAEG